MQAQESNPRLSALVRDSVPRFLAEIGCDVTDELIVDVAAAVSAVRVVAGESLFRKGDHADAIYFVINGRLLALDDSGSGRKVLRRMGRGTVIGEVALMEGSGRTADVEAQRDSVLASLSRSDFERIGSTHPGFLMGITRSVVARFSGSRTAGAAATVAVACTDPLVDRRVLTTKLVRAAATSGRSVHVSAASLIASMEVSGPLDRFDAEQGIEDLESGSDFLVIETDSEVSMWSKISLARSDRSVLVMSADPSTEEQQRIDDFVAAARENRCQELWLALVRDPNGEEPTGSAALKQRWGADRIVHIRRDVESDIARLGRLMTGTGVGLVLGGGGGRGFAHLGVYRALAEAGISVDAIAGASVGGVLGAGLAKDMDPDTVIERAILRFKDILDYTFPSVALIRGKKITAAIKGEFGDRDIEDLLLPFLCVSTNLTTSRIHVHDAGPVRVATRATLAIPGVIPPVPLDGDLLVDGGVLDNLPIGPLLDTGLVDTVIAVDLSASDGPRARADFGHSISGWKVLRSRLMGRRRKAPPLSSVLMRTMIVGSMQRRDDQLNDGLADLLLRPDLSGVSLLAFDNVAGVAERGYRAALEPVAEWVAARAESAAESVDRPLVESNGRV